MAATYPGKTYIALSIVALLLIAPSVKGGFNYAGVCTAGLRFWTWHKVSDKEILEYLSVHGSIRQGMNTIYTVPNIYSVEGDNIDPPTFFNRVTGRIGAVVAHAEPWLDPKYLIRSGYFYSPNCLQGWRPPA